MTTIIDKGPSGPAFVWDGPLHKGVQALYDCVPGGYSVWECQPPMEPKLPVPAEKAFSLLTDW